MATNTSALLLAKFKTVHAKAIEAKKAQNAAVESVKPKLRADFFDKWKSANGYADFLAKHNEAVAINAAKSSAPITFKVSQYTTLTALAGVEIFSGAELQAMKLAWINTPENMAIVAAYNDGGLFGGLGAALTKAVGQIARPALQVTTLGHADQVIHAGQVVARNPMVQGIAAGALTVYTGGLAAGALGGGALATAGGAMVASAGVGKIQGNSFNLKSSLITGATAGVGEYAKTAEIVANPALNAGLVKSFSSATVNKLNGGSFNLQNTLVAGASAALPVAGNMYKADIMATLDKYIPVKAIQDSYAQAKQLKAVADTVKSAQAAYQAYQASKQQGAQAAALQAELNALMAELKAAQAANDMPKQQQIAQAMLDKPALKTIATTQAKDGALKVAAGGLIALKLLAFL